MDHELWEEFHRSDNKNKFSRKIIALAAGGVLTLVTLVNSCSDDESSPASTTTTTVESTTTTSSTTTTTTTPETTLPPITLPPQESFQFSFQGNQIDCLVSPDMYTVVRGDSIEKIVRAQTDLSIEPVVKLIGIISLNQLKDTLGTDPNLIFAGQQLHLLESCTAEGFPLTL